jgi:ABC-2 type transport system ATP-binding protein
LILDEPTTGLDQTSWWKLETVKRGEKTRTVFSFYTHHAEVEAICDRVIIINNGKIVTDKKLDNLISEDKEQVIEVEFDFQVETIDF